MYTIVLSESTLRASILESGLLSTDILSADRDLGAIDCCDREDDGTRKAEAVEP